jgi:small subunit ribosomal protein S9
MAKKQNCIHAVGKRKEASARIRLYKGKGENLVNGMAIEKYFPSEVEKSYWIKPFRVTETTDKYYITAKVVGSGKSGQLDALVLGISRALSLANPEKFRAILKRMGLLTRDSRIRERRMVGTGGKARRKKQSPKR